VPLPPPPPLPPPVTTTTTTTGDRSRFGRRELRPGAAVR